MATLLSLSQELIDMIAEDLNLEALCAAFAVCPRFLPALEKRRKWGGVSVEGGDVSAQKELPYLNSYMSPIKKDLISRSRDYTFNLDRFLARYDGYLAPSLRHVHLHVNFPPLSDNCSGNRRCRITAKDIQLNHEIFTKQVDGILTALKIIERGIEPMYKLVDVGLTILNMGPQANLGGFGEICSCCLENGAWHSRLLNPEKLPKVQCITSLGFGDYRHHSFSYGRHHLDEQIIIDAAHALPNLKAIDYSAVNEKFPQIGPVPRSNDSHPREGPLRDIRHDFAKQLWAISKRPQDQGLFANLEKLKLWCWGVSTKFVEDNCQTRELPDLTKPYLYDPVSSALRTLSQTMVSLDLKLIADSTLFWPCAAEDATTPSWPRLKHLSVEFHPSTPTGSWYFQGPRGEGREAKGFLITENHYPPSFPEGYRENDEVGGAERGGLSAYGRYSKWGGHSVGLPNRSEQFRTEPIDDIIEPFLRSFGQALRAMPVLESANLETRLSWVPSYDTETLYESLGVIVPYLSPVEARRKMCSTVHRWGVRYSNVPSKKPRLEWQVGEWRPSENTLGLFHNIGDGLEEIWKKFEIPGKRSIR